MHKGIYSNMNRAARRACRRRAAAGLCSLVMAFSGTVVQQPGWIMGGTAAVYAADAAHVVCEVPEGAVQIDISTLEIKDEKCICVIDKDGDYHVKGSNLRNGVRIPTQIQVAEGVHVNLYLDGVDIENNDGYAVCGKPKAESMLPLDFYGEAVVYIVRDSEVRTNYNHAVNVAEGAVVTIEDGETLTAEPGESGYAGINVSGTFCVNGGGVYTSGAWAAPGIGFTEDTGGSIIINGGNVRAQSGYASAIGAGSASSTQTGTIEIHGGRVIADGSRMGYGIGQSVSGKVSSVWIDGGIVEASGYEIGGYEDINAGEGSITVIQGGYIKENSTLSDETRDNAPGLTGVTGEAVTVLAGEIPDTSGQSVKAMVTYKELGGNVTRQKPYGTTDMKMSDTNLISAAIPTGADHVDVVLEKNGSLKGYVMKVNGGALEVVSSYEPHTITYRVMENGSPVDTITGYTDSRGDTQLPSGMPEYDYTFTKDGKAFDGTGITEDITVDAERTKHKYTVTYTGAYEGTKSIAYGDPVWKSPEHASWMYVDSAGAPATSVKGDMTVYVLDGAVTDEDGLAYYLIKDTSDFETFVSYIKSGKSYLNARLAQDLTIADWTPFQEEYCGTFDGAGHTITYHILESCPVNTEPGMALFQYVNGAVICNLRVDGTIYTKEGAAGGIVGIWLGKGQIVNCSSDVEISFRSSGETDATVGGFVGGIMDKGRIHFKNCLSSTSLSGVDGMYDQGGFVGWAGGTAKFLNCFTDAVFQNGASNPGETFAGNNASLNDYCYYTNACGSSTQGKQVTSAEAVSAEIAWKLNTDNGTKENSHIWAQADGTTHPILADAEHKAVERVTFEVSGEPVSTVYTKKDGTVEIPAVTPSKEGCDFAGWYIGKTPVTETTVVSEDAVVKAAFKESVDAAKERLRAMLGNAATTENGRVEAQYTTASYMEYKQAWDKAAAAAQEAIEAQTAVVEDIWQAIGDFEKDYPAATEKLVQADGTAHILYGDGRTEDVRYASGDDVKLGAEAAKDGYVFRGWYEGENPDKSSTPVTKELSGSVAFSGKDVTYQAVYAQVPSVTAPELAGTYGDKVSELTISGGAATVAGSWKLDVSEEEKNKMPGVKDNDSYTLTFIPDDSFHYEKVSVKAAVKIAPKAVTVTINDASKVAGAKNPEFGYQTPADGVLAGSDRMEDLNIVLSCTADSESAAGQYPITGTYSNDNYNVTFVDGTLTVKSGASQPSENPEKPGTSPSPAPGTSEKPEKPGTSEKPGEPGAEPPMGDVDGNGNIELEDAQLALKHALKIIELDEKQKKRADVIKDDTIDFSDVSKILRAALRIETI